MEDLKLPVCESVRKKELLQREKGEGLQKSNNGKTESNVEKQKEGTLKRTQAKFNSNLAITAGERKQ